MILNAAHPSASLISAAGIHQYAKAPDEIDRDMASMPKSAMQGRRQEHASGKQGRRRGLEAMATRRQKPTGQNLGRMGRDVVGVHVFGRHSRRLANIWAASKTVAMAREPGISPAPAGEIAQENIAPVSNTERAHECRWRGGKEAVVA